MNQCFLNRRTVIELAEYTIRQGNIEDAAALAAVEAECFPKAEAATAEEIRERLSVYPNHFLLLYRDEKLVGFIDGMTTEEKDLQDEMYEDASLHNEKGAWQMIFGLNTIPAFRRQGCAGRLIEAFKKQARDEGKKGIVLTCKDRLVHYYAGFGFVNEGVSGSTHGHVVWYQMRLTF